MESDSHLSITFLSISLALFAASTVSEASVASLRREPLQELLSGDSSASRTLTRLSSLPMGPTGAIGLLKVVSFAAALSSASALVITLAGVQWPLIAVALLAALALLGGINGISRALGYRYGEPISAAVATLIHLAVWPLNPIFAIQAALVTRVAGRRPGQVEAPLSSGLPDTPQPLDDVEETLDEHEVQMIRGVVRLDRTTAREIMVPRVDIAAVDIGTSMSDLAELMMTTAHSRIPVYRGELDRIEGIAYARDILRHLVRDREAADVTVGSFIRPALFIPESKTLEELLDEFQEKRVHIAIVVDEYGGVSGIATIEDLLEEIVGEIIDEFDTESAEPKVLPIGADAFMVDASVGVDQLNELWSVSFEGEGFDTLGGFVYQRLGKIPSLGDSVEYDGLKIEVVSTAGRRLKRLRVTMTGNGGEAVG